MPGMAQALLGVPDGQRIHLPMAMWRAREYVMGLTCALAYVGVFLPRVDASA